MFLWPADKPHVAGAEFEFGTHYDPTGRLPRLSLEEVDTERRHFTQAVLNAPLPDGLEEMTIGRDHYLTNGGKLYPENVISPEACTQEAANAYDLMIAMRRMRALMRHQERGAKANGNYPGLSLVTGPDPWGNTLGQHLNICTSRQQFVSEERHGLLLVGMLAANVALFGAGHLRDNGEFATMQKGNISYLIHEHTVTHKSLLNTRDEPHATSHRFRRLHIVGNDMLHSPYGNWLRNGLYELLVAVQEQRADVAADMAAFFLPKSNDIWVRGILQDLTNDPSLTATMETRKKGQMNVLDLMEVVVERVDEVVEQGSLATTGPVVERQLILDQMKWAITMLRTQPEALDSLLDWRLRQIILQNQKDKGKDHAAIAKLNVMLDANDPLPQLDRAFQRRLTEASDQHLADVRGQTPDEIAAAAADVLAVQPGTRAELRARLIHEIQGDITQFMPIDWHIVDRQKMPDPAATELPLAA